MKQLLNLLLLLTLQGCVQDYDSDVEIWWAKGFPKQDLAYNSMWFRTMDEGYLFGTYSVNDPRRDTATVYKTIDGGLNWEKMAVLDDFYLNRKVAIEGDYIFLESRSGYRADDKVGITKFDLNIGKFTYFLGTGALGGIWTHNNSVFVASRTIDNSKRMIMKTDLDLHPSDSIFVNSIGDEYAVFFGEDIYNITRTGTGDNNFFKVTGRKSEYIALDILPQCMIKQDEEHIVLMGMKQRKDRTKLTEPIEAVRYNVLDGSLEHLKTFDGYTLAEDFKSNDKVMTVFVGNMKSFYNSYDLAYSTDKGQTWKIKKLAEKSYIRPTALIDNVLYIMSGGGRIQKVTF